MTTRKTARRHGSAHRSLAEPFSLRLFDDQLTRYQAEAEQLNRSVNAYLRDRLDAEDQVLDVLDGMLDAIQQIEQRLAGLEEGAPTASGGGAEAINVETVMLLRQLLIVSNRKNDIDMIKGELKRHGLTPWEPTKVRPGD